MQAFDKWRAEHVGTVLNVRQHVNEGAQDAVLRPLVEEARQQLWTLFAMKKAVVCSESVLLIMNLEHLLPPVSPPLLSIHPLLSLYFPASSYLVVDCITLSSSKVAHLSASCWHCALPWMLSQQTFYNWRVCLFVWCIWSLF